MKENKAFQFIGNMPRFDDLLSEVLLLTDQDWSKYTDRKLYGGAAAENTKTIPLMFDLKNRINSGILHENHECFSKYIDDVVIAADSVSLFAINVHIATGKPHISHQLFTKRVKECAL